MVELHSAQRGANCPNQHKLQVGRYPWRAYGGGVSGVLGVMRHVNGRHRAQDHWLQR